MCVPVRVCVCAHVWMKALVRCVDPTTAVGTLKFRTRVPGIYAQTPIMPISVSLGERGGGCVLICASHVEYAFCLSDTNTHAHFAHVYYVAMVR